MGTLLMHIKLAGERLFITEACSNHCWYFPNAHWVFECGVGSGITVKMTGKVLGGTYCVLRGRDDSASFQPEKERARYKRYQGDAI